MRIEQPSLLSFHKKLSAISEIFSGVTTSRLEENPQKYPPTPHIALTDLDAAAGIPAAANLSKLCVYAPDLRTRARPGDVLLAARGTQFRVAIVEQASAGAIIGANLIAVRLGPELLPEVLAVWLTSPAGKAEVQRLGASSNRLLSLTVSAVAGLEVPIPPRDRQAQIAALYHASRTAYRTALAAAECRHSLGRAAAIALLSATASKEP